tara:strand:+ start:669 stop:1055 length:387 start_codon:yes stop_codon:yes gene_type:complete
MAGGSLGLLNVPLKDLCIHSPGSGAKARDFLFTKATIEGGVVIIEKNVPVPTRTNKSNSKHRKLNTLIETWEVGDSVAFKLLKKPKGYDKTFRSPEAFAVIQKAKKAGQKITSRTIHEEGVVRIWRIE